MRARFFYALALSVFIFVGTLEPAQAFNYESLKKLIQEKSLSSVEEVLPYLPEAYRSKYSLMFHSRSIQAGSFENPRVLMFGDNASFIISFNGDPSQKGFDGLETMEFDPYTKGFAYREILFERDSKSHGKAVFPQGNSERCLKCHGDPARPIWDTDPVWPGAYGERYHEPLSPPEQKGITEFLSRLPNHPRYKYLLRSEIFGNKETFNPSHENKYNGRERVSPNEALSRFLSTLNTKRIIHILQETPDFAAFKYSLLGSMDHDCGGIEYFIPEKFRDSFLEKYKTFLTNTDQKNQEQERLKRARSFSQNEKSESDQRVERVALNALRYLSEYGLGVSTHQWTTALESGTYDFTAPQAVETEMENELLAVSTKGEPELEHLALERTVSSADKYCSYLRNKSVASLMAVAVNRKGTLEANQMESIKVTSRSLETPILLATCAGCHDGSVGPSLPFHQPQALARLLSTGKYPHGSLMEEISFRLSPAAGYDRMPRGLNIDEGQRQGLEKFFRTLQSSVSVKEQ